MRRLSIIGIGAGNPDHITVQATKALRALDAVFLIDKGDDKDSLAALRKDLCARYIENPSCGSSQPRIRSAIARPRLRSGGERLACTTRGDLRAYDP